MTTYINTNIDTDAYKLWEKLKELILKKYAFLTNQDFDFIEGKESDMIERLAYKLCISKEDMMYLLERCRESFKSD